MRANREWVLGGIFVVAGVIMLLNNFGITDIGLGYIISEFWPLVLILWGLQVLIRRKGTGELISGLILLTLGVLIIGKKQGLFDIDFSMFWKSLWPVLIILVGLSFLRGPKSSGKRRVAFMGGLEKKQNEWVLEDETYWAVMGGIELDLRKAVVEDKEYSLTCNAIMGGIDLVVPTDITVFCEGTAILGGVELLGESSGGIIGSQKAEMINSKPEGGPVVRIYCRAFMGGVEVKAKE